MKAAGDTGDSGDPRDPRDPRYPQYPQDPQELKKEEEILDDGADIFRVAVLARVKAEAEAKERAAEEVFAGIRARMEAEQLEREMAEL